MTAGWQFWIDRGGTFTDIIARQPDGKLRSQKRLSDSPIGDSDPALDAIRDFMGVAQDAPIDTSAIEAVKMGTTVATNALLERTGERTVLCITEGFADALQIGYQNRPDIFARHIQLPRQHYERVIEVRERTDARGSVRVPLDESALRDALTQAHVDGIRACAVVLMHGYLYPEHELRVGNIAEEVGLVQVSLSHRVSPLRKLVSRGDTTVVDAYLSPVLRRKVAALQEELAGTRLFFMQSNGGLSEAESFGGKDSILSGPAGGIVGAAKTCEEVGLSKIIAFDMGGTSTDVAHYAGELERNNERTIAGSRLSVPMLDIHTIAAGGGSIASYAQGRFRVGPASAGADPGPACYRRGGPLTLTDCNLVLGRIRAEHFPHLFGPDADQPPDLEAAKTRLEELRAQLSTGGREAISDENLAASFVQIGVDHMAAAVKKISLERGRDLDDYALCCFGGAGGQHACMVAEQLGMQTVIVPPLTSVLSALGIGLAELRSLKEAAIDCPLTGDGVEMMRHLIERLADEVAATLREQGAAEDAISIINKVKLQYEGSDTSLETTLADPASMRAAFEALHRERFGFIVGRKRLRSASVVVEAVGRHGRSSRSLAPGKRFAPRQLRSTSAADATFYSAGAMHRGPVLRRTELSSGDIIDGPAMVVETDTTVVVDVGWRAEVLAEGHLRLERTKAPAEHSPLPIADSAPLAKSDADARKEDAPDPLRLELFNNVFRSIAEQMGITLCQAAHSVNIKERMDFSCALFDQNGDLVANAPHVPVHLGSMGASVRAILDARPNLERGEVFALNDPYRGGTHLPDITVVTPVFIAQQDAPSFFVASRGHHADVGGVTPGSMPPKSQRVDEEGVLLTNFQLVQNGEFLEEEFVRALQAGDFPARNIPQNIADIEAQIAANETGRRELEKLVSRAGLPTVCAFMGHVQANAEQSVRELLKSQADGHAIGQLDSGAKVEVRVHIDREHGTAVIDFTGTSEQQQSNFNAPRAVCEAAVLYVFRTLIEDDIPMNQGCLIPIEMRLPERSLLSPSYPAAVVAGNVETSQLIANTLFRALGALAESQSTMNNFTFGDGEHQYYETICGGAGAGEGFDGASAVHTHMTNSRITDPEVLEARHPVLLRRFCIRRGSGGGGQYLGGDGIVRELEFLAPMTAAVLSNNRVVAPKGLAGGADGALGRNTVVRSDGRAEDLGSVAQVQMEPGDLLRIETPGGGGFGEGGRQ